MNGMTKDLKPDVAFLLRRHRLLGNGTLLSMIPTGFGGMYLTHEYGGDDSFIWAATTFCIVLAEAVLGYYHLSRSKIPVNDPCPLLNRLFAWGGVILGSGILFYAWSEYFSAGDDYTGLGAVIVALYIFLKPMQYFFMLYNYKKGVYFRMGK